MGQVLIRALALLKRPGVIALFLLVGGGGSALVFAPLFGVPGYELSAAIALLLGTLGGGVGIAAGSLERRMIVGRDPRPKGAIRREGPIGAVAVATFAAFTVLVAAALIPFLVATGMALFGSACDPFAHAGFYPLLTLPSALLAAAAGVFCALATGRTLTAAILYALLVLASGVFTAWPVFFGPQVFAYNHFGGFFPGPLYDEALSVRFPLAWFRLQTLLVFGFVVFFTAFCLDLREGRLSRPHFRPVSLVILGLFAAGAFMLEERAPQLGFRMTQAHLAERLGGFKETEHFYLHYGRGKPREELERFVRDLEFRYAQISAFLGGGPPGKIRVFLHRSAEEKLAAVGAGRTQFAKPWRLEFHVNDAAFPHSSLKHELAHAMAAPLGTGLFATTSRFGVLPNMGVVEGFAVAADDPVRDYLTLHEWAAGMRRQKLAPEIRRLFRLEGFYTAAASRAYTLAGSFLRYLADKHGQEKLRALYAHGDLEAVYGEKPEALFSEWEKFLDELPLDETAVNQAFARFRQGSMFVRPCAREVATLDQKAGEALSSDPEEALLLYRRCRELQPSEPEYALGEAKALAALDRKGDAKTVLDELSNQVKGQPSLEAEVFLHRAQLAVDRGKLDDAKPDFDAALALSVSPTVDRTARVMLSGLSDEKIRGAVFGYFDQGHQDLVLLRLERALSTAPTDWTVNYLLGRRLEAAGAPTVATRHLSLALSSEGLPDSVKAESLRLLVRAHYRAGDCAGVRDVAGKAPDLGAAFRAEIGEWVARCDFEEKWFEGALSPDQPFK